MATEAEVHELDQYAEGERDKALGRILKYRGRRTPGEAIEALQEGRPELELTGERLVRVVRRIASEKPKRQKP